MLIGALAALASAALWAITNMLVKVEARNLSVVAINCYRTLIGAVVMVAVFLVMRQPAAVLIGNEQAGRRAGLKPRARIRAFANIGSEPAMMLTGPVDVTRKVLKRAGMTRDDIDLFELNEAFASVVLRYMQAFEIDHAKINVNGGAIALGHPLGATGAMILGTVLDELERRDLNTALVTLCIGAGMGTATIIERI